jgi:type I restriction enzyme, S subunit
MSVSSTNGLPNDWSSETIGSLFDIRQGKSLARHKQTGKQKKKFLRTANVLWGKLDLSEVDEMDFSQSECEALALQPHDLLVCEGGDIGRTAVWRDELADCYYQNHLHRLRAKDGRVNPHFVMLWMQAAITQLRVYEGFGNKTTIPNLSRSRLSEFSLPLPPKSEQEKIAAVLWKIQKAVEIEDAIVRNARDLKKSLLSRLFTHGLRGEPLKETEMGPLPESWDVVVAESLFKLSSGKTRPREMTATFDEVHQRPVYGGNGVMGYAKEFFVDKRALVIGRVGEYCGAVHISPEQSWITDNALYSKEWLRGEMSIDYVAAYLDYYDLNQFKRKSSQPLVSQSSIHQVLLPVPDGEERNQIAAILQTVDRRIDVHDAKKGSLQDLFKTMLHKLMTAQIRVNDLDVDTSEVKTC